MKAVCSSQFNSNMQLITFKFPKCTLCSNNSAHQINQKHNVSKIAIKNRITSHVTNRSQVMTVYVNEFYDLSNDARHQRDVLGAAFMAPMPRNKYVRIGLFGRHFAWRECTLASRPLEHRRLTTAMLSIVMVLFIAWVLNALVVGRW